MYKNSVTALSPSAYQVLKLDHHLIIKGVLVVASFKERINLLWEEAKNTDYTISKEAFAKSIGATRSQLRGWLTGAGEPDTETLKVIATVHNVSIDWLTGFTDVRRFELKKGSPQYLAVLEEIKKEAGVSTSWEIDLFDKSKISTKTLQQLFVITEQIKKEIAGD